MTFLSDFLKILSPSYAWDQRDILTKSYTGILIVFLVGLLPMPYGYYFAMRGVVCIGLFIFLISIKNKGTIYFIGIVGFLILYNPIFPIQLGSKFIWIIVNIITIGFLYNLKKQKEK